MDNTVLAIIAVVAMLVLMGIVLRPARRTTRTAAERLSGGGTTFTVSGYHPVTGGFEVHSFSTRLERDRKENSMRRQGYVDIDVAAPG